MLEFAEQLGVGSSEVGSVQWVRLPAPPPLRP
jgi:hypothetical protein